MQPLQNLWPQLVCTGSRNPKRQIRHSYSLSNGGSKNSSYPLDIGSSNTFEQAISVPKLARCVNKIICYAKLLYYAFTTRTKSSQ